MVLQAYQHGTTSCLKKRDILKGEFLLLPCHNSNTRQEHTHARSDTQDWVCNGFGPVCCTVTEVITHEIHEVSST